MAWEEDPGWAAVKHALGSLVIASGQLEHTVECVAMNLANGPTWNRTLLLAGDFGAGQMLDRTLRLCHAVLDGSLRDDVVGWLGRVRSTQAERNDLVHAHWSGGLWTEKGTKHGVFAHTTNVRKATAGVQRRVVDVTAEDVGELAGRISALDIEGLRLIEELQRLAHVERLDPNYGPRSEHLAKWARDEPSGQ